MLTYHAELGQHTTLHDIGLSKILQVWRSGEGCGSGTSAALHALHNPAALPGQCMHPCEGLSLDDAGLASCFR